MARKQDGASSETGRERIQGFNKRMDLRVSGGDDVAAAPDTCFDARTAAYAWHVEAPESEAFSTYFHEIYHALSNYLATCCIEKESGADIQEGIEGMRWLAQGAAEYFGVLMASKVTGKRDHLQEMLKQFHGVYAYEGGNLAESATEYQAAALVLMVQRGVITEGQIADGRIFHNCDYVDKYNGSKPEIKHIFDNFGKVQHVDDAYRFSADALRAEIVGYA